MDADAAVAMKCQSLVLSGDREIEVSPQYDNKRGVALDREWNCIVLAVW